MKDKQYEGCEFYIRRHKLLIDVIKERHGSATAIDILDEVHDRLKRDLERIRKKKRVVPP